MRKRGLFLAALAACTAIFTSIPNVNADASGTKSVYVLSTYKGDDPTDADCGKNSETRTIKYAYDSNGLLIRRRTWSSVEEYAYKGSKVKSVEKKAGNNSQSSEFVYDNKGNLEKIERNDGYELRMINDKSDLKGKASYHSRNGEEVADCWSYYIYTNGVKMYQISEYSVTKSDGYQNGAYGIFVTCDQSGNPASSTEEEKTNIYLSCKGTTEPDVIQTDYEYVYEDGRLAQMKVEDDYNQHWTRHFYYKKISVPSIYAKAVKEQQKRILWNDIIMGITNLGYPGETLAPVE